MIHHFTGDYRWLSNFWPCDVVLDNETYPSVEHAYQAAKTLDPEFRSRIRRASSAGIAKHYGRKAVHRKDWDDVKLAVMEDLLRQKFSDERLYKRLQETNGKELIEGNHWGDRFWGVWKGEGENHLGKLLMKIREDGNGV